MTRALKLGLCAICTALAGTWVPVPVAAAQPVQDDQCLHDPIWAKLHPQICYTGGPFGMGGGPQPGGGGNPGLIGSILGGLGHLL